MKAQLYFLNNILFPLLDMAKNRLIQVFFADRVHLTYGYQGGYCGCKERRCVPSAYGKKRANLLGFMNAVTYETINVMNNSYLNSDSVCNGLDKLRKKYPDEFIYVILDNATYQRCKKIKAEQLNIVFRIFSMLSNSLLIHFTSGILSNFLLSWSLILNC
ncbi:MAG: hypothetical protein K2G88_08165 [Oscillospiraceae bacterium]|nr:hypothetical protein [Oscillospiraceae bacterium]